MPSVTQRVNTVKQPKGGYVPVRTMQRTNLTDDAVLYPKEDENIHPSVVGLVVDYLTRFISGESVRQAFDISLKGAALARQREKAEQLLGHIQGLDDTSITAACQLVGFDSMYRAAYAADIDAIQPNTAAVHNIRVMVTRSIAFLDETGPVVQSGFTFEGGYTATVTAGDSDYLTADTLWDFKVSVNGATNKQTLQILMYYLMGKHSIHKEFDAITHLGIFNPRLHRVYRIAIADIDPAVIEEVENNVIGYAPSISGDEPLPLTKIQPTMKEESDFYTVTDITRIFGFARKDVYRWIQNGFLPAHKKRNRYIISKLTFYEFLEEQRRM